MNETVKAISELMQAWKVVMDAARVWFPNATDEELYQICKDTMMRKLGR